jgi:hypothetical protein
MNKAKSPAFDADAFLKSVGGGKAFRTLKKNDVIYSQGDAGDHVFFVQKGRVKVVSEHGKRGHRRDRRGRAVFRGGLPQRTIPPRGDDVRYDGHRHHLNIENGDARCPRTSRNSASCS